MTADERRRRADEAFERYLLDTARDRETKREQGSAFTGTDRGATGAATPVGRARARAALLAAHPDLAELLEPMLDAHDRARRLLAGALEGVHADLDDGEERGSGSRPGSSSSRPGTGGPETGESGTLGTAHEWRGDLRGRIDLGSVLARRDRSLESALVARIVHQLEQRGQQPDADRARRSVRSVLARIFLDDDERAALRTALAEGEPDPFGHVVALRAREALLAGLRATDPHGAARGLHRIPRVVFLGASTDAGAHLDRIARATTGATGLTGAGGSAEEGVLVLTERGPVQELLRRLADQPGLSLRLRAWLQAGEAGAEPAEADGQELELVQVRRGLDFLEQEVLEVVADQASLAASSERPDPLVGQLFDLKYRIQRRIGTGGFGTVYEAVDETGLGNRVAIKVLRPRMGGSMQAFRDEARRVVRLGHANIVDWKVFDVTGTGVGYFVMELLEGEELDQLLQREKRLAPERAARFLLQMLGALRAAHELGAGESILHLDLKPKNVFVLPAQGPEGERVKVFDFGIGQYIGGRREAELELVAHQHDEAAELAGLESVRFGSTTDAESWRCRACTPEYASPEQSAHVLEGYEAVPLDGRSDVYSLGVVGFQMLTGELPFPRPPRRRDALLLHLTVPARSVRSTGVPVPRRLARFIDRCLVGDREERWTAAEAHAYLERVVDPPAWHAVAKVAAALILLFVPIAWALSRSSAPEEPPFRLLTAGATGLERPGVLSFGPLRPRQRLTLPEADLERIPPGHQLAVVSAADGSPVLGWSASWSGDDVVVGPATPGSAARESEPEREIAIEAVGTRARSFPLRVAYLAPEQSRIVSLTAAHMDVEELDRPVFAREAELRLGCARGDLTRVQLIAESPTRTVPPNTELFREKDAWLYRWKLEELGLGPGRHRLRVEIEDPARNVHGQDFELILLEVPLSLDAELRDEHGNVLTVLTGRSAPVLTLRGPTDRKVDLDWRVVDAAGEPVADLAGRVEGVPLPHEVLLPVEPLARHSSDPFEGRVSVVVSDAPYVLYARGSDDRRRELEFQFTPYTAEFEASLVGTGPAVGDQQRELEQGRVHYVPAGIYALRVSRPPDSQRMPFDVHVTCSREGATKRQQARNDRLRGTRISDTELDLDLRVPGRYELDVQALAPGATAPDTERRFGLVVDGKAELELEASLLDLVRKPSDRIPEFRLRRPDPAEPDAAGALASSAGGPEPAQPVEAAAPPVEGGEGGEGGGLERADVAAASAPPPDAAPGRAPRAPIGALRYRLERNGVELDRVDLEDELDQQPLAFTLRHATDADGRYRLTVEGRSLAGVEARVEREWTVATRGPEIDLAGALEEVWRPARTGKPDWTLEVPLEDANGIAVEDVACAVRTSDGGTLLEVLIDEVRLRPLEHGRYLLVANHAFGHHWSEREVVVEVVARDVHGNDSEATARTRLDRIRPDHPRGVTVTRTDGSPLGSMRFVSVTASGVYTLGGRSEGQEREGYHRAGIDYEYGENVSWVLDVQLDEGRAYYLDEREVSVGEFVAFLREGYLDPEPWIGSGEQPDAARRDELLARLGDTDPGLPVEHARWAEAFAYARWAGKRLPSFFEWEYAVRAGTNYRMCSVAGSVQALEGELEVRGAGPRPVADPGPDVTPITGLRGLCTNASEWTGSPVLEVTSGGYPRKEALDFLVSPRHRPEAVAAAASFWRAGGDHRRPRYFDFSLHFATPRHMEAGFRCALSADEVLEGLAGGGPLRFARVAEARAPR